MAKSALQAIAATLAGQYGLKQSEATAFVNLFFEEIQKGLEQEKLVKVRGLGTFKLQTVKPRESVNVNTGERVLIGGHEKMAFTPDNALKELVNRPFADFETVMVKEGVDIDSVPTPSELLDVEDEAEMSSAVSATEEESGAAEKEVPASLEMTSEESAQSEQDVEEVHEQMPEQPFCQQGEVSLDSSEDSPSDASIEESRSSEEVGKEEKAQEEKAMQEEKTPVAEDSLSSSAAEKEKVVPVSPAPHAAGVVAQAMTASEKFSRLMDEEPIEPSRGTKEDTQKEQDIEAEREKGIAASSVETVLSQSDDEEQESREATEHEKAVGQRTFSWAEEREDAADPMNLDDSSCSRSKRLWIVVGVVAVVLVLLGAAFYLGGFTQCGQRVQEAPAVKPQTVSKKKDAPKRKQAKQTEKAAVSVADTLQVASKPVAEKPQAVQDGVDLEKANDYPAIRYGAYHITGIDKKVVLRKGETMAKYCRRTLGKDMIGYFEAINGAEPLAEGDTLLVPRVELRPEYRK